MSSVAASSRSKRRSDALRTRLLSAAIILLPLSAWAYLTTNGIWSPQTFSSPRELGWVLADWFVSGSIYPHIAQTYFEVIIGLVLGVVLGGGFALLMAASDTLYRIFSPFIVAGNAIPRVILAPIFVLWLGFGPESKIAVVIAMVFFPNFFNIYHGLTTVNSVLINRALTLGAGRIELIRYIYVPSVAVWALASLRASVGFAFLAAVVAEYVGSSVGVGYLIGAAAQVGSVTEIFAGICVIMLMVLPLSLVVSLIEARLERWRPNRSV